MKLTLFIFIALVTIYVVLGENRGTNDLQNKDEVGKEDITTRIEDEYVERLEDERQKMGEEDDELLKEYFVNEIDEFEDENDEDRSFAIEKKDATHKGRSSHISTIRRRRTKRRRRWWG